MISGLHHYALEVPDLAVAEGFLQDFGLETGEKDGAHGDQRSVLLSRLQTEVLQEALGHRQIRHFQRVVVQP